MTKIEKESFVDVCKKCFNTFLTSSAFGASRYVISSCLERKKINIGELSLFALSDGLDLTTYQFYKNIVKYAIDPKLDQRKPYILIPTIGAISVAAVLTNYFIVKKVKTKISNSFGQINDETGYLTMTSISTSIYNISTHYVGKMLPKPQSFVYDYLNSTCLMIVGNTCDTLSITPYITYKYGESPPSSVLSCFTAAPYAFVENAIYYSVKGLTEPFYFKVNMEQ